MNVSDEDLSEAAELLEEFSAQSIVEHTRGGRLIGSPKAAKRIAATLRAALSTAERASDEGAVAPRGYVKVEDFIEQEDEFVSMLNDLFALLQDVKAERDAALAQTTVRPVREWQPIETAPKDGRTVIVNCREGRFAAYYDPYYAEGGMGYEGGDGWSESLSGEQVMTSYGSPTHWMPLPDAPNGVVGQENGT